MGTGVTPPLWSPGNSDFQGANPSTPASKSELDADTDGEPPEPDFPTLDEIDVGLVVETGVRDVESWWTGAAFTDDPGIGHRVDAASLGPDVTDRGGGRLGGADRQVGTPLRADVDAPEQVAVHDPVAVDVLRVHEVAVDTCGAVFDMHGVRGIVPEAGRVVRVRTGGEEIQFA